jgi:hypothetical protein
VKAWLKDFPTTAATVAAAISSTMFYLLNVTIATVWYGHSEPAGLGEVLIFLGSWLGISTAHFIGKRTTFQATPPIGKDAEDVASPRPAPDPTAPAPSGGAGLDLDAG